MTLAPHIDEIELPTERDGQVSFYTRGSTYWIRCTTASKSWTLIGERGVICGHFMVRGSGFAEIDDVVGVHEEEVPEWRRIVQRFV